MAIGILTKRNNDDAPTPRKEQKAAKGSKSKESKRSKKPRKPVRFHYSAINKEGVRVKGREKATSRNAVFAEFQARGWHDIQDRAPRRIWSADVKKKKVKPKFIVTFSTQLSVYVRAGVPIVQALDAIASGANNKLLRSIVTDIVSQLREGSRLSAAMERHPEAFSGLYVAAVNSAEMTGRLDETLTQMAALIDREVKAKARISSALVYPGVVAVMGAGTIVVLSTFVLPKFKVFFKSFNAKLPLPTRMLMAASAFLTHWGLYMGLGAVAVGVGAVYIRKTPIGKMAVDRMMLRIPVIGKIVQSAVIERVCRITSAMLRAGVDLPRTLTIAAETARNGVFQNAIHDTLQKVMKGRGLASCIEETAIFDGIAQQMFIVGEQTGTLDFQLNVAADYYSEDVDVRLEHAVALLEPMILIVVGAVVGFVALAMVSAMYGIYNQVHVG